jgi:hypothetical protein
VEWVVREVVGAGGRNDPVLYAHMNNKTIKKFLNRVLRCELRGKNNCKTKSGTRIRKNFELSDLLRPNLLHVIYIIKLNTIIDVHFLNLCVLSIRILQMSSYFVAIS